jgi:cell division protein FtsQ
MSRLSKREKSEATPKVEPRNTRRPRGERSEAPVAIDKKPRTQVKAPSAWAHGARGVLGFLLVLAIGGTVVWGARRYVRTSPRFAIRDIKVVGAKRRTPDSFASEAGIDKGLNIFALDLEQARSRLLQDPWVTEASMTRQLPNSVVVHLVEREAAGLVVTNDGTPKTLSSATYLVTSDAAIIKPLEVGDPTDLPIITGVVVQQLLDDREGTTRAIRRALDLATDYEHSAIAQRAKLEEVHLETSGELTIIVGQRGVAIHLGNPPYRRKFEEMSRVWSELDRRGAKPDAIMLDNEARPERVVVRMR